MSNKEYSTLATDFDNIRYIAYRVSDGKKRYNEYMEYYVCHLRTLYKCLLDDKAFLEARNDFPIIYSLSGTLRGGDALGLFQELCLILPHQGSKFKETGISKDRWHDFNIFYRWINKLVGNGISSFDVIVQ